MGTGESLRAERRLRHSWERWEKALQSPPGPGRGSAQRDVTGAEVNRTWPPCSRCFGGCRSSPSSHPSSSSDQHHLVPSSTGAAPARPRPAMGTCQAPPVLTASGAADFSLPISWLSAGFFGLDLPRDLSRCCLFGGGKQPPGRPSPSAPSEASRSPDPGSIRDGGTLRNHPAASSVDPALCSPAVPAPTPPPRHVKSPSHPIFCSDGFLQMKGEESGSRRGPSQPFPRSGMGRPGCSHHLQSFTVAHSPTAPSTPWLHLPHGSICPTAPAAPGAGVGCLLAAGGELQREVSHRVGRSDSPPSPLSVLRRGAFPRLLILLPQILPARPPGEGGPGPSPAG